MSDSAETYQEIHELAHAVLSGRATAEQQQRLEELVIGDDEACWLYVRYMHESAALHRLGRAAPTLGLLQARGSDSKSDSEVAPADESTTEIRMWPIIDRREPPRDRASLRNSRPHRWLRAGAIAACGAVLSAAIMLAMWAALWRTSHTPAGHAARIAQSVDAVWEQDGQTLPLASGDWLHFGRYSLTRGIAQLVFPWGTEVTLESPTEFELSPEGAHRLLRGQLVAKVTQDDTGFEIDTPTVKVIDLGTEFGVSTAPSGASEVHVFKRSVEARGRLSAGSDAANPIRLRAGQATIFTEGAAPVREILFNPKRFSRAWRVANHVADVSGGMYFIHPPPASVVEGETESSEHLSLFLERERVTLTEPLAVTAAQPGFYTTFVTRESWLSSGLQVDSYVIHFDPLGSDPAQAPVTVKGSVTFDRPIVAVIARGDQLATSDRLLSTPGTEYLRSSGYQRTGNQQFETSRNAWGHVINRGLLGLWHDPGLHNSPAANDWIRLSGDRMTLSVSCTAGGEADQLRVLVASQSELPDHLDAPSPPVSRPFRGEPFRVGDVIQAEDFDIGGDGAAYYDRTSDALANTYRTGESVELTTYVQDERRDVLVCLTRAAEWLAYTVEVDEPGVYCVEAHLTSGVGGSLIRFDFGDSVETESLVIPRTENSEYKNYLPDACETVVSSPVTLKRGRQVMRAVMERDHDTRWIGLLDWFRIVPRSAGGD